jgi:hypothetical protein
LQIDSSTFILFNVRLKPTACGRGDVYDPADHRLCEMGIRSLPQPFMIVLILEVEGVCLKNQALYCATRLNNESQQDFLMLRNQAKSEPLASKHLKPGIGENSSPRL